MSSPTIVRLDDNIGAQYLGSLMQWAAVRMWLGEMMEPPQLPVIPGVTVRVAGDTSVSTSAWNTASNKGTRDFTSTEKTPN